MAKYYIGTVPFSESRCLRHFGILGMKWGVRRYQNPNGTLTAEGKARYSKNFINDVKSGKTLASAYTSKSGREISRSVLAHPDGIMSAVNVKGDLDGFNIERLSAESEFFRNDDKDFKWMASKRASEMKKNGGWDDYDIDSLTKIVMNSDLSQNLLEEFMKTDRGRKRFPELHEAEQKMAKSFIALRDFSKEAVSEIMGSFGDQTVSYSTGGSSGEALAKDLLANVVENYILNGVITGRFN